MPTVARRLGSPLAALALFAGAAGAFCWLLWAPNAADRAMIGPAAGDFMRQFYPYRAFAAHALASGMLPLWNPHAFGGNPALADPQLAVLYPWRLLQAALALGGRVLPVWSVDAEAVAHLALGGWFTFLLLRRLRAGTAGAVFGGLTYAFGGYMTGYPMEQLAVLDTAAWLPAPLWALSGAMAAAGEGAGRRAARWTAVAAGASAMSLLAGHPQTALYGLYAAALWWLYLAVQHRAPRAAALACGLGWALLTAGLSAAQVLPTLGLATRAAPHFERPELLAGLPVADAVQVLVPNVVSQWSPLFVGTLALAAALFAARRLAPMRFWLAMAVAGWLLALGGHTPLLGLALRVLPGLALFRHHERAAVLWALGLAVASGLAVGSVARLDRRGRRQLAATLSVAGIALFGGAAVALAAPASSGAAMAAGARAAAWCTDAATAVATAAPRAAAAAAPSLAASAAPSAAPSAAAAVAPGDLADGLASAALALLAAAGVVAWSARDGGGTGGVPGAGSAPDAPRSARRAAWGLALVAALELGAADRGRSLCPQVAVYTPDAIVAALRPHARDGRVSSEALLPGGPNAASVFGLYDVTGDSPLRLRASADRERDVPEVVRWRLEGVRYVLTDRSFPPQAPVRELVRDGGRALYETQLAVPPAWVPARVALVAPGTDWPFAPGPDYDPAALAPFEADLPRLDQGGSLVPGRGADETLTEAALAQRDTEGEARLVGLSAGHMAVEATLDREGVVIQSTTFDPGWRATARPLDAPGAAVGVPVRAAYGSLVAVALPAGRWRIEWTYLPIEVIVGFAVTGIALLVMGFAWRPSAAARR